MASHLDEEMTPVWTVIRRLLVLALAFSTPTLRAEPPVTVAEKSNYQATARHAEVMAFSEQLAKESPRVRLGELAVSTEGRKLPLIILADPPVSSAQEAGKSNKPVVFAIANIHAGEVDGKEALLMLARDLALAKEPGPLKNLIVVLCPNFNPDGNEKISKENRLHQTGPAEGVGLRTNGQGFDLNRDFVKLESPEVRGLVHFLNEWDPAIFIDCHTTNGSFHRYTLTYEGGRSPIGDEKLNAFTRDELLPEVGKRVEKQTGYKTFYYGNFSADRSRWESVPPTPRYSTHYASSRNRIGILSESYVYAPYKDRVLSTRAFVQNILDYASENRDKLEKLLTQAKTPRSKVPLRFEAAAHGRPMEFLGFVEEVENGKRINTGKPKSYEVIYQGASRTTKEVDKPTAYLFPASYSKAVELLQRHGIKVEQLREDIDLEVVAHKVDRITRSGVFQKHQMVTLTTSEGKEKRRIPAGTIVVRTDGPLGSLASFLLEPQASDGLATWNFFDDGLKEGGEFPVLRLADSMPLFTAGVRPLAEHRKKNQAITMEMVMSGRSPNFSGSPLDGLTWLEDGEHYLQSRNGQLQKVHAVTGRGEAFYDAEKVIEALAKVAPLDEETARRLVGSGGQRRAGPRRRGGGGGSALNFDPTKKAALFNHEGDYYLAALDGSRAVRLTKSGPGKELVNLSPDGQALAYVRGNNLHAVDSATQTERQLTSDGGELVYNGKASWVYFEEIYNRNWQSYWWSPDSKQIAFLRHDDTPVPRFDIVDTLPLNQRVEATRYPKAGKPNPLVKAGIASISGGPVRWVTLPSYPEKDLLITRVGWLPDSQSVYLYVQDRAQTWLDLFVAPAAGGEAKKLFRETTKAWVEDLGPLTFLKDGSFLLSSEHTGYKHIFHYEADGKLRRQITDGPWEAREMPRVDEQDGWIYFNGMKDNPIGNNFYRVRLDGTDLTRLTPEAGSHDVSLAPRGPLFIDTYSSHATPTKVRLGKADASTERMLDTNPVYTREEYRTGAFEMVKIKTPDGFELEGSLLKPPSFDPNRKYPVWFMTYAGPHMPTIRDGWSGGRVRDEALADMGFIVFHADPRSASGKGVLPTWSAYKQLGVQELKDIETMMDWLTSHSWVDGSRIGMSGASYGGFITAFALTHSKRFAAGIADAAVTDWSLYDSIYTERYMNTPQVNKEGYEKTSVVRAAKNLHGKLLLIHGLMDDNVHAQNFIQLVDALQRAGKDFEIMFYPRARHGSGGPHHQKLTTDFMKRVLKPGT
ncbi:MAG: DPP IV N-terminal domain-containing protein [Gemmataceae bacterium]